MLRRQWGHLFPWSPVFFGTGIAIYFALPAEPGAAVWIALAVTAAASVAGGLRIASEWRVLAFALALLLAGILVAAWRSHAVAAPALSFRYYGPIEGRIVQVDRSQSDAVRLTLDRVRLAGLRAGRVPEKVRVSLHGMAGDFHDPAPGEVVMTTGHLSPLSGPVEPGGFDFRRQAWFLGIGAVGYTRTPLLLVDPVARGTGALAVERVRHAISARVREVLPGRTGAFAAAVTTGDRSAMDAATLDALRDSNLAHLLAISGLHMGMLTGFVFAVLRLGLAAWPRAALGWPIKKIAATGGLVAGAGYLALSGGNVATERAFIMVAVMLLALLLDRRAISLRSVAVAAMVVLVLRPEALMGPGFQMSFAATTALVAVFEALRQDVPTGARGRVLRWMTLLILTSFVAGMATAPFAAAHFNRVPHYGLLANVLSVPLMGFAVMPGAVLAALLAPFGAEALGLHLMAPAIDWILAVATRVAAFPGAVTAVKGASGAALALVAAGGLILALWRGPGRLAGTAVAALGFVLWTVEPRPALLVAESGSLLGVLTEEGRALSKPKGDGFSADSWLENDGDAAGRDAASTRAAFEAEGKLRWLALGEATVLHATGKTASAEALSRCGMATLTVVDVRLEAGGAPPGCEVYDARRLSRTGALAVDPEGAGLRVVVSVPPGGRPWAPRGGQ